MYAMRESLRIVHGRGLWKSFAAYQKNHELLAGWLEKLGFEFLVEKQHRTPNVKCRRFLKAE